MAERTVLEDIEGDVGMNGLSEVSAGRERGPEDRSTSTFPRQRTAVDWGGFERRESEGVCVRVCCVLRAACVRVRVRGRETWAGWC